MQPSAVPSFRLRTTGLPSPAVVRDHRDRSAAGTPTSARVCNSGGIDQISIANNREPALPWLYRVGLIETKHPVCVGALIHPSLILTTAVKYRLTVGLMVASPLLGCMFHGGGGGGRVPEYAG
uniref:Uncharacterized protein n=1 Tax=Anopheles maculatus TaxID=74869 RepID=A0A182SYZ4_9DIPT